MMDNEMLTLPERLSKMIHQETSTYKAADYLSCSCKHEDNVRKTWRQQICEWSYAVVDHFKLDREVVSISLSYIDRYLSRYEEKLSCKMFQLVAMTSLYLAIKLHGTRKLNIASLIRLSKGHFTAEHILHMEWMILRTLSWNMHPPTPLSFVRDFLSLIPSDGYITPSYKNHLMQISTFLTELSVCDYFFVLQKPSSIALACILNAMDETRLPRHLVKEFIDNVCHVAGLNVNNEDIQECRTQLRDLYKSSCAYEDHLYMDPGVTVTSPHPNTTMSDREEVSSPVCVNEFDTSVHHQRYCYTENCR